MKMIYTKKVIALALLLCVFTTMFAGCTGFYKASDDNTLSITMWASADPKIMDALRTEFPDINFDVHGYAGSNSSLYLKELLQRGKAGDIFFYTTFYNDSDAPKYLVDLSGYPFLTNYDKGILSRLDVDGAIYQVPSSITVRYVVVNKTLFEEKGWKIPENFDETVAVCRQIREEAPEIAPLGLGILGAGFVWTLVTSYAQMGFLDTTEGQAAEKRYREGTASFGEAFGEGLDMVSQLIDAGAFMPERFNNIWDVSPKQMGDREAAMCYVMGANPLYATLLSGQAKGNPEFGVYNDDEFIALPLYGKNAKTKGLILGTTNTWGISKSLEQKGNEKKLENALRVLEYISTEEGQMAICSDPAAIPSIKALNTDNVPEFMRDLWNDNTNSIKSFFLYTGYEHMMVETAKIMLDAMYRSSSEGMKEEFIRLADQLNNEFLENKIASGAYGYAEDDLSVEQTRKLSCEAFRTAAGADIAIASEGGIKNGTRNRVGLAGNLFKGKISIESFNLIIAATGVNVVSVYLTGSEIKSMMENGKVLLNTDGAEESFTYWSSGQAIDDNTTYKVAMLYGDYSEEFADSHEITDTGVGIVKALGDYFSNIWTVKAED